MSRESVDVSDRATRFRNMPRKYQKSSVVLYHSGADNESFEATNVFQVCCRTLLDRAMRRAIKGRWPLLYAFQLYGAETSELVRHVDITPPSQEFLERARWPSRSGGEIYMHSSGALFNAFSEVQ